MRWCCIVVVVAILSLAAAPSASAEEPAGYLKLIEAGLNEYYAHHFVEARALFAQAHTLNPNARTLRVLGMAEFELRRYPQSLEYLRAALASQVHPLDAELRARTLELEQRALTFVGQVHLELQPAAASITIDDVATPLAPSGLLVLQAGEHTLEARADSYRSARRKLDIKGGEELTLRITLERELFKAAPATQTRSDATPLYASPWLWTGVGVVLAGAATALIFALKPARVDFARPEDTAQTPVGARVVAFGGVP